MKLLTAGLLGLIIGLGVWAAVLGVRRSSVVPPEKTYSVLLPAAGVVFKLQADAMDVKDACIVFYRKNRVDTVLCPNFFVAEEGGETSPTLATPRGPNGPTRIPSSGQLEAYR